MSEPNKDSTMENGLDVSQNSNKIQKIVQKVMFVLVVIVVLVLLLLLMWGTGVFGPKSVPDCTTKEDCSENQICQNGSCITTTSCTENSECAQGEICQNEKCVSSTSPNTPTVFIGVWQEKS